ncbi:hypothetical protein R1sor_025709 [Riccia sorocarpa]|uniref:Uncharacterized protein n=1 Tax=Riccia sorocarpa TaxID=122646 RepID=A0ABD3GD17_9MARC
MQSLQDEQGNICHDEDVILERIHNFYGSLYSQPPPQPGDSIGRTRILGLLNRQVEVGDNCNLIKVPELKEVETTINNMAKGKAPGEDGVTAKVLQLTWGWVQGPCIDFLKEIHHVYIMFIQGRFIQGRYIMDNIRTLKLCQDLANNTDFRSAIVGFSRNVERSHARSEKTGHKDQYNTAARTHRVSNLVHKNQNQRLATAREVQLEVEGHGRSLEGMEAASAILESLIKSDEQVEDITDRWSTRGIFSNLILVTTLEISVGTRGINAASFGCGEPFTRAFSHDQGRREYMWQTDSINGAGKK